MTSQHVVGRLFDVEGGQVHAEVREGGGPVLIFLHYWGGSRRTWGPVLQRLDPGQGFVAYDQRGWGESASLPGPYDLERLADDAQRVIDALGHSRYVLVGHSMGGKVAQLLAARKPKGLIGVVLVAPAPPAPIGVTEQVLEAVSHAYDSEEAVLQGIDRMLTHSALTAELRRQVVQDSLRGGEQARLAWPRQGMVRDLSAGVAGIEVPVLVLGGSHDKVDPPAVLADHLLPLIPTASLSVLTGTGHLSPLEVPDQIAAHISTFITRLQSERDHVTTTVKTPSDMSAAFTDRMNAGDLDGLVGLLAPEAVSRTPAGEVLTDPTKIRTDLAGLLARRPHLVNTLRHTFTSGDVALMLIDWTLELDAPDGRARLAGTTANVVRRDEHGAWRLAVLNPTGTTV